VGANIILLLKNFQTIISKMYFLIFDV
jgi:hypothetical protein